MAFDSSPWGEPEHKVPSAAQCARVRFMLWLLAVVVTVAILSMAFKSEIQALVPSFSNLL